MKATDLLRQQHQDVERLFERIENAPGDDQKSAIFKELATAIGAHDVIERELFYPACEEKMGLTHLLGEALVEHGVVEFSLYLADKARGMGGDELGYKLKVLRKMLRHHVEEEEKELFPRVEKALGAKLLEELGLAMKARFEKAKRDDFRGPLHDNLRQVLAGVLETVPDSARTRRLTRKSPAKHASATH
jgi:hemerythrin superfamily protein